MSRDCIGPAPRTARGPDTTVLALLVFGAAFGAVLVRQLLVRGPPVWTILGVGGLATVGLGVLPPDAALSVLGGAVPVLVFLLALFLFAAALQEAGALEHLARWLVHRAPRPRALPVVLFLGFGLASAFLVNDALVVIGVPVLLAMARRRNLPPRPLLLTLAFAVTVGSVLTPFGNPQNLLVSVDSGVRAPVATFLRYLLFPTVVNLAVGALYLRWRFSRELDGAGGEARTYADRPVPLLPVDGWRERLRRHPVLVLFPVTILVLITVDVTSAVVGGPGVPIWWTAGAGAAALLLTSPQRTAVVRGVNWQILLLFVGLFVVVGGAVHGGLVRDGEALLPLAGPSRPLEGLGTIVATAAVGSQLVSNVPWVAVQIPVLAAAGYGPATPVAWTALAGASTLAGNVTVLGAASNLIVLDLAERSGVRIGLRAFVGYGLPLAAVTLGVLLGALLVGL